MRIKIFLILTCDEIKAAIGVLSQILFFTLIINKFEDVFNRDI